MYLKISWYNNWFLLFSLRFLRDCGKVLSITILARRIAGGLTLLGGRSITDNQSPFYLRLFLSILGSD